MKKYELTNETIRHQGHTLHRIKALKDFADVKAGDLGGWIESEKNLSQEGTCWVYDEAKVCGNAEVSGDAEILGNAEIFGNTLICGHVRVFGNARVYGNSWILGNAKIYGNARIFDNAKIYGNTRVFANAHVCGNTFVNGSSSIFGRALVYGDTKIFGTAKIFTKCNSTKDYLCLGPIGSRLDYVTFTKSDDEIYVATGCFKGTLSEFKAAVAERHGNNCYGIEYTDVIEYIEKRFRAN